MALPVIADDGSWVNGDYERLGRIIKDYDSQLALAWIPPEAREAHEKFPYAVIDTRNDQIVFLIKADETPVEILQRLFNSDATRGNVLDRLHADNAAVKAWQMKTNMDELREAQELALFMVKSPLNFMKITNTSGEKVKLDDQRRRIE
jgi:hypothetical protein